MTPRVERAVVLGAGTMGAQLACLLAASAREIRLLDLDAETAARGLERATKLKPAPLYQPSDTDRIRVGAFDELEDVVRTADWILEAVVEKLDPKRELFARVDAALEPNGRRPIVSTNTSGLSIAALARDRSDHFHAAFLGTHFFNPPRYARLVEVIPTPASDPEATDRIEEFASRHLGKGTVRAKDTPAFIANRLGVHGMLTAVALALELGLGVDEIDELTGQLIGRPKSATFRTLDLVGLDVAVAVADHCHAELRDDPDRERFRVPDVLRRLLERGALGEKTGAGFYRRENGEILALDLETLEYRPRKRLAAASVQAAALESDPARRLRALVSGEDQAAVFLWRLLSDGLRYSALVGPAIADDATSVDRALQWGFGHERGPFETWDLLGAPWVAERMAKQGAAVPPLVEDVLRNGGTFYRPPDGADDGTRHALVFGERSHFEPVRPRAGSLELAARKRAAPDLPGNAAASLVDLGGGVLGLELHGKLNVIGLDTLDLVLRGTELASTRFDGLVIGTLAADFSAGANLALLLLEAEEGEWDSLDYAVRRFQGATTAIRTAPVPVVVAPRGRTLGGGAEFCLAADRCQPLAETYVGLVEAGVGLIPGGGGSTTMAARAAEGVPDAPQADLMPCFRRALETIAFAKVATSAFEARSLGLFRDVDAVTADPDRQWADARATVRHLADLGYRPPGARQIRVIGRRGIAAAEALTYNELLARHISEHDRKIVLELATVLSGGDVAEGTVLPDTYVLDLEREAFLRLLGEPLTRERIRHTLKTGKPLRN